jgi:hypothetical protein
MRTSSSPPVKGVLLHKKGFVTSVQAVYVDLKDPAPAPATQLHPLGCRLRRRALLLSLVITLPLTLLTRSPARWTFASLGPRGQRNVNSLARNATRLRLLYRRFSRITKVFGSWQGNLFPSQSITPGPSPRVPVAACTEPGACQHDFSELAVLGTQYYACDHERGTEPLHVAEVLGARPFQWGFKVSRMSQGMSHEGRARNDCEWTHGWLDPPHV